MITTQNLRSRLDEIDRSRDLGWLETLSDRKLEEREFHEGTLEWFDPDQIDALPLPETDRRVIWPLIRRHEGAAHHDPDARPGFFAVHIDCSNGELNWRVEHESAPPVP